MARIAGVDIPRDKRVEISLRYIYGIGPTLAQRIIEYRSAFGFFTRIEDIMNVSGVGPSTFDQIKSYIVVGP